jgi:hypothetical protein
VGSTKSKDESLKTFIFFNIGVATDLQSIILSLSKSKDESLKSFIFFNIGVAIDLQSIILSLCSISTVYFPKNLNSI